MKAIPIPGAELYYITARIFSGRRRRPICSPPSLRKCAWERRKASFGNAVPRDEAYYGDPGTHYTYSRRLYTPLPWIPELLSLKLRVEEATPLAAYANSGVP